MKLGSVKYFKVQSNLDNPNSDYPDSFHDVTEYE